MDFKPVLRDVHFNWYPESNELSVSDSVFSILLLFNQMVIAQGRNYLLSI